MTPDKFEIRPAVHCFLKYSSSYVLTPLAVEEIVKNNIPKTERDFYLPGELNMLSVGMLQWVSGGQKQQETPAEAMIREIYEELGLSITPDQLQELAVPQSLTLQQRGEVRALLIGTAFELEVSDRQLAEIKKHLEPTGRQVELLTLPQMLNGKRQEMRPFAQAAIELLTGNYPIFRLESH